MADTSEYLAHIQSLAAESDFLAAQREAPELLAKFISGIADAQLRQRPQPDKWSVGEIIAHLAEDELVTSWRYRQMLENNGVQLAGFDQDLWARASHYETWTPQDALTMFRLLREANLRLLDGLSPEDWQRHGIHAERGKITIQNLARHMAGHDRNHLEQVRKILHSQGR